MKFPYLSLGHPELLNVGHNVLAIGNNLGFSNTVTDGIISAVGRAPANVTNPVLEQQQKQQQQQDPRHQQGGGGGGVGGGLGAGVLSRNPYCAMLQTNANINQGATSLFFVFCLFSFSSFLCFAIFTGGLSIVMALFWVVWRLWVCRLVYEWLVELLGA